MKARVFDLDGGKMSAGIDIDLFMQNEEELQFPKTDESLPFKDFLFFRKEYSNWMLFTGRLDKNGNEIYEGDIFGNEALRCVVEREEDGRWVLVFVDKRIKPISILDHKVSKSAIMGNIFENPELIKGGGK